ncbi:MAG: RrF2 family transcriptional regulator [Peptococcaceae bacterium]|nr:RrF2 family transcriptional regulator [Peptococcaceae bacterium]
MKISTRGRYALRLMLDLAQNDPEQYVTIKSISERQEISGKYLEQIISVLSRAGYVKSSRGSQGGYKLARPAGEYTVGMILRLIEGSLVPVACMEDEPNRCPRSGKCATLDVWKQLDEAINGVIDHITLADLVEKQKFKL